MSKAFTKESDAGGDDERDLPDETVPGGFMNYITPAGHKGLNETIAWAASNGDRSENGDYIYGKRKLREIDRRIRFLSKRLDSAVVVDNAECIDADACTEDACAAGQCAHAALAGFAGADCQLAKLLAADVCGAKRVDPKLAKALTAGVAKIRARLRKADAAAGKKRGKLVGKAASQIAGLSRKAKKSRKTPAACRTTITTLLASQRELVLGLKR